MELLDGETLRDRLRRSGSLSPAVTVRFLSQAASTLDRAHALGIVHRDFKPENIVVVRDEETKEDSIKVLDFGVAKLVRELALDKPGSEPYPGAATSANATWI